MGLGIRRLNRAQDVVEEFGDDADDSFLALCVRSPKNTLRRGISPYDLTMFNTPQLERLVVELAELPEEEQTPIVKHIVEQGHQAIRRSGYMLFIGD
ncbi:MULTISPECIES: hypothetical protein [unclassified Streptomyces]|uniref:hypothetical protein n=1 Tax=unclassified Streptomyces TaxID=2593676 RepID=UPI0004BD3D9E|nr:MULTISPECIES: hypothetical protein [unclassified Streptomyces]